jgi:hypothetical protein
MSGMEYIKQEPFCALHENDNKPANIKRHDGIQSLFMEQLHDTSIKSELTIEESKPIIEELVALIPVMQQESKALPEVRSSSVPNTCSYQYV